MAPSRLLTGGLQAAGLSARTAHLGLLPRLCGSGTSSSSEPRFVARSTSTSSSTSSVAAAAAAGGSGRHARAKTDSPRQVAAQFATGESPSPSSSSSSSKSSSRGAPQLAGAGLGPRAAGAVRVRIAVDVDEVLGRFLYALNDFVRENKGMDHQVSDFFVYEFAKIWLCDQDQSNKIVHEFFQSQHFTDGIPVIPGAYEALGRLADQGMDMVVVTSRQHVIQEQTQAWIDRHFPGIFQEVLFGNHWSLEGVSRKKSDICRSVGASVLIDDNPGYALECAAAGIHVLLYDWHSQYPWSKLPPGFRHPLVTVVRDWAEVEAQLERLAPVIAASQAAAAAGGSGGAAL